MEVAAIMGHKTLQVVKRYAPESGGFGGEAGIAGQLSRLSVFATGLCLSYVTYVEYLCTLSTCPRERSLLL